MQMEGERDQTFMLRCLELAGLAKGYTYPNPLVGSVITHNDEIIGEGYHREFGKAHAEGNAIASVKRKALLTQSTLYVNLEPCCHVGKTPPCTDLILAAGIPRIVIGSVDPNPAISGKGIAALKKRGCDVTVGILDRENRTLNRSFFTHFEKKRPFVILKWAESLDGFLDIMRTPDTPVGPHWITSAIGQTLVHKWRAAEQAIMVGGRTVLNDNPSLTVRYWTGRQPLRITITRKKNLSKDLHLLDGQNSTLIYTDKKEMVHEPGITYVKLDYHKDTLPQIMNDLYNREIQSLIVEGGKKLLESFISSGLWDEALVFTGNSSFYQGLKAPTLDSNPELRILFDHCKLKYYRNIGIPSPKKGID
jgi:diaminohydroxyphosphoribosylaminopyrimidine deaminase/5-amino-6-(5-phosphoribosylamino)uracil reductase